MLYQINWRGDNCHNYYPNRNGFTPIGVCNHITAGTRQSVYWWFTSPNNKNASATFCVGRNGDVDQYVDLHHGAWTQGLSSKDGGYDRAIAPIVKDKRGVNPNFYLVSIEYEGYTEGHKDESGNVVIEDFGIHGDITEEQFLAGCWLHKYIQTEVERIYGKRFPLNNYTVEGHFRIDPRRKPFCPGPLFNWNRLYAELAVADGMTFDHYEERIDYLKRDASRRSVAFAIANRINDLGDKLKDDQWGAAAAEKLEWLYPVMDAVGGTKSPDGVKERVLDLYHTALGTGKYEPEAVRKLLLFEPVMKDKGLL